MKHVEKKKSKLNHNNHCSELKYSCYDMMMELVAGSKQNTRI